jgi:hypothetical protein
MTRIFILVLFISFCTKKANDMSYSQTEDLNSKLIHPINQDSIIQNVLNINVDSIAESIKIDLNNDNYEDLVVLHKLPQYPDDPGVFSSLTIYLANDIKATFETDAVFDEIPNDFVVFDSSAVNSKVLAIYPYRNGSLIFAFGYAYGSGRAPSIIVEIENNNIKQVFLDDYNQFVSLAKLNSTDEPKLVLRKNFENWGWDDSLDVILTSYCPYSVFVLHKKFEFDSLLTLEYNKRNYVFKGFQEYDSEIIIAEPRNGSKPFLYIKN